MAFHPVFAGRLAMGPKDLGPESPGVIATQSARKQFAPEHLPEMAAAPHEAVRGLVRNKVDEVRIEEAAGRIAATPMLGYPPGVGVIVPGERIGPRAEPRLDTFRMFEESSDRFSGLDAEVQGVDREAEPDGRIRFLAHVRRDGAGRSAGRGEP